MYCAQCYAEGNENILHREKPRKFPGGIGDNSDDRKNKSTPQWQHLRKDG